MVLYEYNGKIPKVGVGTFLHDNVDLIGDVIIGDNCYIGLGVRIKGDYASIRIGNRTIIEDNTIIHGNAGETVTIGSDVIIGHGCIIHSCTIKDCTLIGIGSIISDMALVEEEAIVGEGCVVPQRQTVPKRMIVVGIPARIIGEVTDERINNMNKFRKKYLEIYKVYGTNIRQP